MNDITQVGGRVVYFCNTFSGGVSKQPCARDGWGQVNI